MFKKHIKLFFIFATSWFLSLVVVSLIFNKDIEQFGTLSAVIKKLPLGVAFTLCQTFIEEAIFRGWYFLVKKRIYLHKSIYIVVSGALFSMFHIFNSEVENNSSKWILLLNYFIVGAYFMYLVISTNSLLSSFGCHFGNNIFTFFIVSSLNSSSPFLSLYKIKISEDSFVLTFTTLVIELSFTFLVYFAISKRHQKDN